MGGFGMVEKQLAGFFNSESDFRGTKGAWERGKDSQRPTATTLQLCTEG